MSDQKTSSSPSLYNIDEDIRGLLETAANFEEGVSPDIVDNWLANFEENKLARKDKIENILRFVRSIEAWAGGIDEEMKRLSALSVSAKKKANNLLIYLERSMRNANESEMKTDLFKLKFVKNPPRLILSEELMGVIGKDVDEASKNLRELSTELSEKKKGIKDQLKKGESVDGAELVQTERLKIE